MDEEKEQNNGQTQDAKSALNQGGKKLGKQAIKSLFRKIIALILPWLLKFICIAFVIYLLISAVSHYLDILNSEESKDASSSAIDFSAGTEIKANKIAANANYITTDGAYELQFNFEDEKGNSLTESQAISDIEKRLKEENEKIKLNQFSQSELKILGMLMNNGIETGKYNEQQLKALAMFVKADIASQSLDLRPGTEKPEIKIEDLTNNDEVYGTIELHKTTATTEDGENVIYKEIKLEYVPYETFTSMIEATDNTVLEKFSIDDNGNVVIAKSSSSTVKYTYQYPDGSPLSDSDMARLDEIRIGEDEDEYIIKEYVLSIDYKQYIKKYIASYGFLSDLLLTTNNVDFCLEIAELAFNSKIVLNIREEQVDVKTYHETDYTDTSLFYDYVKYGISGYKVTTTWTEVDSGTGDPEIAPEDLDDNYQYTFSGDEWTLSEGTDSEEFIASISNESSDGDLIANEHLSETYEDYSVSETYTRQEIFNYKIIIETTSRNFKYDIDISEIDCWYLIYNRPYAEPTKEIKEYPQPDDIVGQYPQEKKAVEGVSAGAKAAAEDFLEKKKNEFASSYPSVNKIEGSITSIRTEEKKKTDGVVAKYEGTRTIYKFGDESTIDTTQVQFKNLQYVNNKPAYTPEGKKGFLYIYDQYMQKEIDLCLQNDAEKEFFEMLEGDFDTSHISDIMRFLLYVYDGIDRGVTDLDKSFKVIDMTLTDYYGLVGNAFGCTISRDEFISKAQGYGESILANLAPQFYDICEKYNVNPCLAYGWAALESGWGSSAVNDKNLFQMGSYNDATSGFTYPSYEAAIEDFCKWVVNAADPSTSAYNANLERAKEYATVNNKFNGTPDKNVYALFSRYSWVGHTHTENARACIKNTYEFLDGIDGYKCEHSDSDPTTLQEQADYMQYQVELRLKIAEDVFGEDIFLADEGDYQEFGASSGEGGVQGGTYVSTSGRTYIEWIQGTGEVANLPLFDAGVTMGAAGCGVYACGTLASSTGIEPTITEVYKAYKNSGNCAYVKTIETILDKYGVHGSVCTGNANNHEEVISVLTSGKGVMIYVGPGYGQLYTKNVHWITLADIRVSQNGSEMGYDVYALTSKEAGHGWQPIETVLKNLKAGQFYYIDDGQ